MHLQPDLDEVDGGSQAHGDQASEHAGQRQVQHATREPPVAMAVLAYEPLGVVKEAKHHGVIDRDADQGKRHALEEASNLHMGIKRRMLFARSLDSDTYSHF